MKTKVLKRVGGPGHWVSIVRRSNSPYLYLRWWNPRIDNYDWSSLKHTDMDLAETQAREAAAALLLVTEVEAGGPVTLGYIFSQYEAQVTPTKGAHRRKEDKRRIEMWTSYLGADFDPMTLTSTHLKTFETERRKGTFKVEGRKLKAVRNRSLEADEAFLAAVFNWASGINSGQSLLPKNPMKGYAKPKELNPKQPRTSYDVFLAVQDVADLIDPQKLFLGFHALLETLGWRVTAICELRPVDFDLRRFKGVAPHGRILKREETDKEGVEQWVPLSQAGRKAIDLILKRRPVVGATPLFKAPKSKKKACWTHHHARKLLKRAYELAKIPKEEQHGFHSYRRKWVDERKHLPRADVQEAGAWRSARTLDIYEHADEETILKVVEEPKKLRRPTPLDGENRSKRRSRKNVG